MVYVFLAIGVALFLIGSGALLRGGTGLFKALGVPRIFIGLLIASLAMSAPEFCVALEATARGVSDIAVGDIFGSTIANCLLVFGLGAMMRPMPSSPTVVFRDGGTMVLASLAAVGLALGNFVPRAFAIFLLGGWFVYLLLVGVTDWRRPPALSAFEARAKHNGPEYGAALSFFLLIFGVICLLFGARFVIACAMAIAVRFQLPQVAVALSLVALCTAAPELAGTLATGSREHSSLGSSQLIASNIFNLLLILGVSVAMRSMSMPPLVTDFAGPVMLGSCLLVVILLIPGWRMTRPQGALLFLIYLAYLALLAVRSGVHFG